MRMKRSLAALLLGAALLMPCAGAAQRIEMEDAHLAFDYPDSWLVVSPQLAMVYERLLADGGIDAAALSGDMEAQGVLSRAYSPDFSQYLSVLTRSDELSEEIFDIAGVTDEQRKRLRSRVQNDGLWETTGLRAQDVEWQREGGVYWLYVHYTVTRAGETVGRGLRYITVRNGQYVMLDWQRGTTRFGNRDLSAFRARLSDIEVTQTLAAPVRAVRLTAEIPAETSVSDLILTGSTAPGATLECTAPDARGATQTLSVGVAEKSGSFRLLVPLEQEGSYALTLTASAEGMQESSVSGTVTYSAKTLPVSLAGVEDGGVVTVTKDETTLTGTTLPGTQMQLVTPFGLSKKRAGNDGAFSFSLTTDTAGEYRYTLILDRDGFNQRRIAFTLVRVMTDDQQKDAVRKQAEKISYKNLQRDLPDNQGKIMSLYGPVISVSASGGTHYVRMQFNKGADGVWYNPVVIVSGEDMGVKAGDMLACVVRVDGVFEEQDAQGEPVMVPRFELLFVDKVE